MDTARPADAALAAIERETRLLEGAILSVASGASRSMVVGGLRFGEALIDLLAAEAREAGVRLTPLWPADEAGCDIRVELADA